jgi:YtkA-like
VSTEITGFGIRDSRFGIQGFRTAAWAGLVVAVLALGCGQGQAPSTGGNEGPASPAATSASGVAIEFHSQPDPPKSGDNAIEVTVRQPDGTAITDAAVTAVFSMPAMPAMNMPAMRSEAKLSHVEGGLYRGMGQLSMAGTWSVTVTATRDGEPLGRRSFSIVAN